MYTVNGLGPGRLARDLDVNGNALVQRSALQGLEVIRPNGDVIDVNTTFGLLTSSGYRMNDRGQICLGGRGIADLGSGEVIATPISPFSMNNEGLVVGTVDTRAHYCTLGSSTASAIPLDDEDTRCFDVNDAGVIVGWIDHTLITSVPFGWKFVAGVGLTLLGDTVYAINTDGAICGWNSTGGVVIATNGTRTPVPPASVRLVGINDAGTYVGTMRTDDGARGLVGHAGGATDLSALLLASDDTIVDFAVAVNASGQILAQGRLQGETQPLLLDPVVKPAGPVRGIRTLATLVHILTGGVLGSGGIAIGPDGRPRLIPPGPLPWFRALSPARRDAIIGIAIAELAELLDDRVAKVGVTAIALERARAGIEQAFAGCGDAPPVSLAGLSDEPDDESAS